MGWLFTQGTTKSDIINDLIATEENDTRRWETIAHSVRGNVLWSVIEITYKQDQPLPAKRFIACYLLKSDKGYGWGYKDMDESMHPFYYSCPLKYLSMVPQACAEWREGVRNYHRQRNRKVKIGEKIRLINAKVPWVEIVSVSPLLGTHKNVVYRVPRKLMGEAIEPQLN
jgi:hypothetical protein